MDVLLTKVKSQLPLFQLDDIVVFRKPQTNMSTILD